MTHLAHGDGRPVPPSGAGYYWVLNYGRPIIAEWVDSDGGGFWCFGDDAHGTWITAILSPRLAPPSIDLVERCRAEMPEQLKRAITKANGGYL